MAGRNFNAKQALEKEVKDLYCEIAPGTIAVAATATLDLTTDIVLTSAAVGAARNTSTFQLVVNAAAANPTNTVLVAFTGTAAAIICTVTPNDGTNNGAVAVNLDEDELAELINTGAVVGKVITLTDASSLRVLQTATGGNAGALVTGDNQTVSFTGGVTNVDASIVSGQGFSSVSRTAAGTFELTLADKYYDVKYIRGIYKASTAADIKVQLKSEAVRSTGKFVIMTRTGATVTQPATAGRIVLKAELKISSVPV